MPDLFRYSSTFQPILLEGMTATLYGSEIDQGGLNVVCRGVGAMPEYQKDFGSLTAATWSNDNEDTNLEMGTMELSQMRMRVVDDMKVRLKNPAAVQQWRTLRTSFYLPQFPTEEGYEWLREFYFQQSEFFVFEDDATPRFDLYSPVALSTSRVIFSGWRFKLQKTEQRGKKRY